MKLTLEELQSRCARFCAKMDESYENWDTVLVVGKANQYYFTGTMQDALLVIRRGGSLRYYVRQSRQRAVAESPLREILPMSSYRDVAAAEGGGLGHVYIEAEAMPYAYVGRLQKYLQMDSVGAADGVLRAVRAPKSSYELHWMEESGKRNNHVLQHVVPALLRQGMSEAELFGALYAEMMRHGHQGIIRMNTFQQDLVYGQVSFGQGSLVPVTFDGPCGSHGMNPTAQMVGSPDVRLEKGMLVVVDLAFGVQGYVSDATQIYMFGGPVPPAVQAAHSACAAIESQVARHLCPGQVPAQIYADVQAQLPPVLQQGFMGYGEKCSRFIGHGVGLTLDEYPVVAKGFDQPLQEGMTLAIEPKIGLKGYGMVGVENTWAVQAGGGRCLTGGRGSDIIVV